MGPRREETVQEEAVSEEAMCGVAAEHGTDGGPERTQEGCLVEEAGGPAWG